MMQNRLLLNLSIFIFLVFTGVSAFGQNTYLSGQLNGLSNDTVQLFYTNNDHWITDTITASNDQFNWQADLALPTRVGLKVDTTYYYFFASSGHLHLTGIKGDVASYKLIGSPMQQDADSFKRLTRDFTVAWDSLFKKSQNASQSEQIAIEKQRQALKIQNDRTISQFIDNHPGSLYSLYLVNLEREYPDIKRLYDKLDLSAKQSPLGQKIAQKLRLLSRRQIGQQMPDFTQPDTSGHPVNFNEFKTGYKYILVDFWASWCAPCRAENPNVLKAYNKYKDKGFTVIGISVDDNAVSWKKAIRHDKMPWTQLSDLKGWKNKLSTALGIEFIPSNLLLDAEGKIIAKDLRGADLEKKLSDLLNKH